MEIRKIRIGNDIRLAVNLRQYLSSKDLGQLGYLEERQVFSPNDSAFQNIDPNDLVNRSTELYYPYDSTTNTTSNTSTSNFVFNPEGTPISIRNISAYIINTSKIEEREEFMRKKTRFIARFPIEPCMGPFDATPYDVCNSGYPTYRAYPHSYHVMPYHGYGIKPCWEGIYKALPHINDVEYKAQVSATRHQHVVEVSFPARAQLYTGKYKLVIVAEVYAPGFNAANLKTVTVDVPDVFELVKTTEEGVDTGIKIAVNNVVDMLPGESVIQYDDSFAIEGNYSDDKITIGRTDGGTFDIDTSAFTGWTVNDEEE